MRFNFLIIIAIFFVGGLFCSSCEKQEELARLEADFSVATEHIMAGIPVEFKDASLGQASKWNWTFQGGDIDGSVLSSPIVVFDEPGEYSITLEVTNSAGSSSVTKTVTVGYTQVKADFRADKMTVIQGDEIAFRDSSSGLVESWNWEFTSDKGAVLSSKEQNPKLKFLEVGVYKVALTVSNPEYSDQMVKEAFIEVLDASNLSIDFSADATGTYEGGSIDFSASSVGTVSSWQWEFQGGSPSVSTEQNPKVSYANPGRYKVTLRGTNMAVTKEKVKEGYIVVVPGNKLAAYFPFSGSVNDAGPNAFVPQVRGTVSTQGSDRKSYSNGAAIFNGSGGLIIEDHPALNFGTNDYTVAVWVKADKLAKMMLWQESGDKGSKDNQTWLRLLSNTTNQLVTFATEDSKGGSFINLGESEKGKWVPNEWFHVTVTRSALKTSIYINGVFAKDGNSSSGVKEVSNAGDFKIGMQRGTNSADGSYTFGSFFNGELDDLIIYNRALSAAEVKALYDL